MKKIFFIISTSIFLLSACNEDDFSKINLTGISDAAISVSINGVTSQIFNLVDYSGESMLVNFFPGKINVTPDVPLSTQTQSTSLYYSLVCNNDSTDKIFLKTTTLSSDNVSISVDSLNYFINKLMNFKALQQIDCHIVFYASQTYAGADNSVLKEVGKISLVGYPAGDNILNVWNVDKLTYKRSLLKTLYISESDSLSTGIYYMPVDAQIELQYEGQLYGYSSYDLTSADHLFEKSSSLQTYDYYLPEFSGFCSFEAKLRSDGKISFNCSTESLAFFTSININGEEIIGSVMVQSDTLHLSEEMIFIPQNSSIKISAIIINRNYDSLSVDLFNGSPDVYGNCRIEWFDKTDNLASEIKTGIVTSNVKFTRNSFNFSSAFNTPGNQNIYAVDENNPNVFSGYVFLSEEKNFPSFCSGGSIIYNYSVKMAGDYSGSLSMVSQEDIYFFSVNMVYMTVTVNTIYSPMFSYAPAQSKIQILSADDNILREFVTYNDGDTVAFSDESATTQNRIFSLSDNIKPSQCKVCLKLIADNNYDIKDSISYPLTSDLSSFDYLLSGELTGGIDFLINDCYLNLKDLYYGKANSATVTFVPDGYVVSAVSADDINIRKPYSYFFKYYWVVPDAYTFFKDWLGDNYYMKVDYYNYSALQTYFILLYSSKRTSFTDSLSSVAEIVSSVSNGDQLYFTKETTDIVTTDYNYFNGKSVDFKRCAGRSSLSLTYKDSENIIREYTENYSLQISASVSNILTYPGTIITYSDLLCLSVVYQGVTTTESGSITRIPVK